MQLSARLITTFALLVTSALASAQGRVPATMNGAYVLQRMHDSYAGKWYTTLTFTQKTTRRRPDGTDQVQTWLESLRYTPEFGTQLRIDIGNLADGRGMLYTADSVWRVAAGKSSAPRPEGNEFIPLIQSVYVQPVAQTTAELKRLGFDLGRGYAAVQQGQPVWVVGAASASDTTVSRFAVDTTRRLLVSMSIVRAGQPPIDVVLGGYERVGNGWLATRIAMTSAGVPVQTEDYTDWKVDVPLPASLFDITQWSSAPHWGRKP